MATAKKGVFLLCYLLPPSGLKTNAIYCLSNYSHEVSVTRTKKVLKHCYLTINTAANNGYPGVKVIKLFFFVTDEEERLISFRRKSYKNFLEQICSHS